MNVRIVADDPLGEYEEVITVTPEMAREWLRQHGNPKNRGGRVNTSRAREYCDLMAADRWKVSGEFAISFTRDGMLANGHTRLTAVVLFGKPVTFVVRRSVDPEALRYVDVHGARTQGQIGHMFGIDTRDDDAIRLIEVVLAGDTERVPELLLERRRVQLQAATALVREHADVRFNHRRLRAGVRAGLIAIAFVRQSAAVAFLRSIGPVVSREAASPRAIVNLVNWIDNRARASSQQFEYIAATINAFEQFVSGSEMKAIRSDGLSLPGSIARRIFEEVRLGLERG